MVVLASFGSVTDIHSSMVGNAAKLRESDSIVLIVKVGFDKRELMWKALQPKSNMPAIKNLYIVQIAKMLIYVLRESCDGTKSPIICPHHLVGVPCSGRRVGVGAADIIRAFLS